MQPQRQEIETREDVRAPVRKRPRPHFKKVRFYYYDELEPEAQERAREHERRFEADLYDAEFIKGEFQRDMATKGFKDAKIWFGENDSGWIYACFDAILHMGYFLDAFKATSTLRLAVDRELLRYSIQGNDPNSNDRRDGRIGFEFERHAYEDLSEEKCSDSEFRKVCFQAVCSDADLTAEAAKLADLIKREYDRWSDEISKAIRGDYEWRMSDGYLAENIRDMGDDRQYDTAGKLI